MVKYLRYAGRVNPWDFKPLKSLFGYKVEVARIESGDILFLRPSANHPPTLDALEKTKEALRTALPEGVNSLIIPADWEIAIGTPASIRDTLSDLEAIKKDLGG